MILHYPSQRPQDWLSQQWCVLTGRRLHPGDHAWLRGPYGESDAIGDRYIHRLAAEENLAIEPDCADGGLVDCMSELLGDDAARLHPLVREFYEHTARFDLDAWSEWNPLFRPFAALVHLLYSRRLEQLNLPLQPLDTAGGIASRIIKLRDPATSRSRYTIWFRTLQRTGRVIYSGVYMGTTLPDGRRAAKIVFPLPRGNATVVILPTVGADGALDLKSSGRGPGDAGFYFLLRDRHDRHYLRFVRSMREHIRVFVDSAGTLRADHAITLWGLTSLRLHYKIVRREAAPSAHASHEAPSITAPP